MTNAAAEALDFDWSSPGALGKTYISRMRRIQQTDPVFWSDLQNAWIVTRHADILAGLKDSRLSNRRYHLELEANASASGTSGSTLDTVRRWMFNNDGREHMRLRTLLIKPFSRAQADKLRPDLREMLAERLDAKSGLPSFEFQSEFAQPLVAASLLKMIGFDGVLSPSEMIAMAQTIVAALVTAGDVESVQRADKTIDDLSPLIQHQIALRRSEPRDDLLTDLLNISEAGDRLTETDIISIFHVLLLAAVDTTSNTMALFVDLLDKSPENRNYIREHPDRIAAIVEELQRHVDMQNMMHRIVAEDFEWHGKQIRKGQMVYLMLGIGNFDESVYPDPETVNFDRQRQQMLAFAPGLHHCLGFHVAKMELEEFLLHIYARYENVAVLEQPEFQPNPMTRCFESLKVRLIPRG